ncbi:hypothetical protein EDB80DRAFT_696161 [Ilyonectria destructans]|nr:hypothetical protein EDB80DRAFT_696161 [Ilyonectria destructans]
MAAHDESVYSSADNDSDPGIITVQIQRLILQLKMDRDERTYAILRESSMAFDNLRSRVITYQAERRKKESKSHAAHVKTLIEATERRKEIEARMSDLIMKLDMTTQELEAMMLRGYLGREGDMKKDEDQKTS